MQFTVRRVHRSRGAGAFALAADLGTAIIYYGRWGDARRFRPLINGTGGLNKEGLGLLEYLLAATVTAEAPRSVGNFECCQ